MDIKAGLVGAGAVVLLGVGIFGASAWANDAVDPAPVVVEPTVAVEKEAAPVVVVPEPVVTPEPEPVVVPEPAPAPVVVEPEPEPVVVEPAPDPTGASRFDAPPNLDYGPPPELPPVEAPLPGVNG